MLSWQAVLNFMGLFVFVAECNRCQLRLVPCKRFIPSIYWNCSQVEFLVQQVSNRCAKEFTKTCSENGGALRNSQDIEINPYRARFPRYTYWCDLTKESKEWLNMNDRLKLTHLYRPTTLKSFSWLHNGKSNQAVFTNMRPTKNSSYDSDDDILSGFRNHSYQQHFSGLFYLGPNNHMTGSYSVTNLESAISLLLLFFLIPVITWLIFIQYSMEKHLSKGY